MIAETNVVSFLNRQRRAAADRRARLCTRFGGVIKEAECDCEDLWKMPSERIASICVDVFVHSTPSGEYVDDPGFYDVLPNLVDEDRAVFIAACCESVLRTQKRNDPSFDHPHVSDYYLGAARRAVTEYAAYEASA